MAGLIAFVFFEFLFGSSFADLVGGFWACECGEGEGEEDGEDEDEFGHGLVPGIGCDVCCMSIEGVGCFWCDSIGVYGGSKGFAEFLEECVGELFEGGGGLFGEELGDGGDGATFEAAGDEEGVVGHIWVEVEGEAVEGDPFADTDADGADFGGLV